jgi:hypothetical protein
MFNVFEQPWTLLGVAVLVLLGVLTFRSVWPEKRKPWQLLLPLFVAGLAFGLDALVQTDLEKVHAGTRAVIRAVEKEDCEGIASWIAPYYRDSRHHSKAELMDHCRQELAGPAVTKIKRISDEADLSKTPALVTLFLIIRFEEQSRVAKQYGIRACTAKVQLYFTKQPDKRWLISRAELLAVNDMPVTWNSTE